MKPEEQVRQGLIHYLVEKLGFPKELIVVEKEIGEVARLAHAPKRRVDIVCFMKKGDELLPLLVIECKAVPLQRKALEQVLGYNYYIGAPFVAIANGDGVIVVDHKGQERALQTYAELSGSAALLGV